ALMNRIPVAFALMFLPAGLAFGNFWVLFSGSLAAAVALKGSEQLFRHSVDRSSLEVLYMAIPNYAKIRLKSLIDTVGVRLSEAVGAILLIVLVSIMKIPFSYLAMLSLLFLAVSFGCTFILRREYPRALKGAIQHDEVNLSAVKATFFTTDFYGLLPE